MDINTLFTNVNTFITAISIGCAIFVGIKGKKIKDGCQKFKSALDCFDANEKFRQFEDVREKFLMEVRKTSCFKGKTKKYIEDKTTDIRKSLKELQKCLSKIGLCRETKDNISDKINHMVSILAYEKITSYKPSDIETLLDQITTPLFEAIESQKLDIASKNARS